MPTLNEKQSLRVWPLSLKVLATCLIITLLIGYFVSLAQVFNRSHFNIKQSVLYYRGDESGDANSIDLPQSFQTMLSVAHVHSFSQPFIFGSLGFIFVFTRFTEKKKAALIALGFFGTILSNLAPWLVRYLSSGMVFFLPVSQIMIALSILSMSFLSLREMWTKKI